MFREQQEFLRLCRLTQPEWVVLAMGFVKATGYYLAIELIATSPYHHQLGQAVVQVVFIAFLRLMYYRILRDQHGFTPKMDKSITFLPVYLARTSFWLVVWGVAQAMVPGGGVTVYLLSLLLVIANTAVNELYPSGIRISTQHARLAGKFQSLLFTWESFKHTLVYEIIRF
jgi:hypothetical protein